jgi:hypothetical protein
LRHWHQQPAHGSGQQRHARHHLEHLLPAQRLQHEFGSEPAQHTRQSKGGVHHAVDNGAGARAKHALHCGGKQGEVAGQGEEQQASIHSKGFLQIEIEIEAWGNDKVSRRKQAQEYTILKESKAKLPIQEICTCDSVE